MPDISPLGHERSLSFYEVNFNTYLFLRDKLPMQKRVWTAVRTMVEDRKKPKSTSSAIFGVETTTKSCEVKRSADRVHNRTDKANLNFSPELHRLIFFT